MALIKKYILKIAGITIGTAGGFLYWKYIGCISGSCPITSNPLNASIYGALMGGLVFNLFQKNHH